MQGSDVTDDMRIVIACTKAQGSGHVKRAVDRFRDTDGHVGGMQRGWHDKRQRPDPFVVREMRVTGNRKTERV